MTFWAPWDPWPFPSADSGAMFGGETGAVVFLVMFCALVDFIKLLVELLGREQERFLDRVLHQLGVEPEVGVERLALPRLERHAVEEVHADQITSILPRFIPGKTFKKALKTIDYARGAVVQEPEPEPA